MPVGKNIAFKKRKVLKDLQKESEKAAILSESPSDKEKDIISGQTIDLLIAELHGARYAFEAGKVLEIIWLPELVVMDETPNYISGIFNYRGRIIPVLDLNIRLGYRAQPYALSDRLIVLDLEGRTVAVIVHTVLSVISVKAEAIEKTPVFSEEEATRDKFISGVIKQDEGILLFLDLKRIFSYSEKWDSLEEEEIPSEKERPVFGEHFNIHERKVLKQRSRELQFSKLEETGVEKRSFVVFRIGDEIFGVDLDEVQEFCLIESITPVPCTPEYIRGIINLRGEIFTIIDIFIYLGLKSKKEEKTGGEAILHRSEELRAGIMTDQVIDVINISEKEVLGISGKEDKRWKRYLRGVFPYRDMKISIMDLGLILSEESLKVYEEV